MTQKNTMDLQPLESVLDWFRYAASQLEKAATSNALFFGHGCTNAVDEAAWLVLATLQLPLDQLDRFGPAKLSLKERALIQQRLEQRIKTRLPLAYVLGEAWLMGERFLSDARAIVPRSLIAELFEDALSPWLAPFGEQGPSRVLDMCCGGGSLTLLASKHFYPAQVTGADLSPEALALAKDNLALHARNMPELADSVRFVKSDLFKSVKGEFDLILCNPPYVNSASMQRLPKEYLTEPRIALDGGKGGMKLMPRILQGAAKHLSDQGALVLELGNEASFFEAQFPHLEVTWLPTATSEQAVFAIDASTLRQAQQQGWI